MPSNIRVIVFAVFPDNVIQADLRWDPPVGIVADRYRVAGTLPQGNTRSTMALMRTIFGFGNTFYTISIFAINCRGESAPATFELTFGKLRLFWGLLTL